MLIRSSSKTLLIYKYHGRDACMPWSARYMDKLCSFMLPDLSYEKGQRQSMSWSSTSYSDTAADLLTTRMLLQGDCLIGRVQIA